MKIQNSKSKIQSCLKKLVTRLLARPFTHSPIHPFTNKTGFTLIEILLIIVIISIAIPTLLFMVGQEAKFGVESEIRVSAANVAQALMEEIKTKKWDETPSLPLGTLGPESGETLLSLFDDADDYNDLAPVTLGTIPCTDTVNVNNVAFTRAVDVCYVSSSALNTCLSSKSECTWIDDTTTPTDYKKITVTITALDTNWGSDVELVTVMTNN